MKKIYPYLLIIPTIIISINGCNVLSGKKGSSASSTQATVSFATGSVPNNQTSSSVTYTDSTNNDSLRIDSAKLLIDKLLFHGDEHEMSGDTTKQNSMTSDTTENEMDEHNGQEDSVEVKFHEHDNTFKSGPYVLDVSLDTTVSTVGITNLPHGTYNKIFFLVHKLKPGEQVSDSDFVDSTGTDSTGHNHYYSVIVKGSYNGKPFEFKSSKTFFVKTWINPPLVVSDSLTDYNATVKIDLSNWFRNRDGHFIDPTDSTNYRQIEWAIRRSFHAFKDNDKDGNDDQFYHGFGHWHHGFD